MKKVHARKNKKTRSRTEALKDRGEKKQDITTSKDERLILSHPRLFRFIE